MNLLIIKDILKEEEAKFYLCEMVLAIEAIHNLDCIHRDIKPDNILIDKYGHIKLSDFGLAKISDKLYDNEKENEKYYLNNKKNNNNNEEKMTHNKNFSCVGTAYYVAPEVLNKNGYYKEIDWWSVGVIFYEMLVGYAPFCSKETSEVCYKVLNWKKFLKIPSKINISEEAKDLIFKMISNSNNRLGKNGADEIKKHPFFNGIDWDNIRNSKPPFVPILKNEYDTSYFEKFEISEPFYPKAVNKFKRKDIEYIGYTFKEDFFRVAQKFGGKIFFEK
jgi:serine/threonine kinase 38